MAINIASFNLYTFSSNDDKKNVKSYDKIANIISDSHADIIALQEVVDQRAVDCLVSKLRGLGGAGRNWVSFFDRKTTHRNNREGYAFLWDENIVALARDDIGDVIEPEIMTRYTSLKRPPMVGRFRTVHGMKYEVCVINVHIIFRKDNHLKAQAHPEWYSEGAMRALEYSKIVREIYPTFASHLNVYAVIAGDYNLTDTMLGKINALGNRKDDRPKMISVQNSKTTIKIKESQSEVTAHNTEGLEQPSGLLMGIVNGVVSLFKKGKDRHGLSLKHGESILSKDASLVDGGYAHSYDHFSFDLERVAPYMKNPHRIDVSETMFPLPQHRFHDYKADVSDHVPIVATLDLGSASM